jgi:beta-glucosidase
MSDWTGTNSVAQSIKAGCDLEMPGPTKRRGAKALAALSRGELTRADIARSAARVLQLVQRTKGLGGPVEDEQPERSIDTPETAALIREAGAQGITLLKNEGGLLPLSRDVKKIALIGPNAARHIVGGGGSATLNPYYTVGPAEGVRAAAPDAEVACVRGCDSAKWLPLASGHGLRTPAGESGVTLEYFKGDAFEGAPVSVQRKETTDLFLWDSAPKAVLPAYSFRVRARLTPSAGGVHTFSFSSVGPGRLFVAGKLVVDNWDWEDEGEAMFEASKDVLATVDLEAGVEVDVVAESTNEVRPRRKIRPGRRTHGYGGVRIGFRVEESHAQLLAEAVAAARAADVTVVVVGLDAEWESEGYDRQGMELPRGGSQDRLVEAVLAAQPRTVVVCQSGSPVALPWVDRAPALLQAWYQGQEAGNALADVLFGKSAPGGKLPMSWPRRIEDTPAYGNWPGEDLIVRYAEGVFVGYRHYEARGVAPLFAFGHGLSYTRFEFRAAVVVGAAVLREGGRVVVRVPVTNVGQVRGSEVVQAYVREVAPRVERPVKELRAFAKMFLEPGETGTAELVLDRLAVGFYDVAAKAWVAEKGRFEVLIGASSVDIR